MRNRKKWIIPAVILACAVAAIVIVVSGSRKPSRVGTILLEVNCVGADRLFRINTDGSSFEPVIWDYSDFSISPDGKHIGVRDGERAYVLNPKSRRFVIKDDYLIGPPEFSPDGRRVTCFLSGYEGHKFLIEDVDGGNRHTIPLGYGTGVALSPDGKHIAFTAGGYDSNRVLIADLDGRNQQFLANGRFPEFSPDGRTIAYISNRKDNQDQVYLIDADGTNDRLLTKHSHSAFWPTFSPDSRKVAFKAEDAKTGPNKKLFIIGADGSGETKLSDDPSIEGVTFSPDGQYLAYSTENGGTYIIPATGGKPRLLTKLGGGDLYWGPTSFSAQPRPTFPGLPKNYYVDKLVSADFDGDGRNEQACIAGPALPSGMDWMDGPPTPLLVLVAKDGKLISKFAYKGKNGIDRLQAIDLTGDGVPEVTYDLVTYGGDNCQYQLRAHRWEGHAFKSIIGTNDGVLFHWDLGGAAALIGNKGNPSRIVLYNFTWGDSESHADPHHYAVEWYDLVNGRFVKTAIKQTKHRYYDKNPLAEFGIKVPSARAKEL